MPYFHIRTNLPVSEEKADAILAEASKRLAEELGKPERYVMVELSAGANLHFSGNKEPAAYVELKSIGLSEAQTQPLAGFVCNFLEEQCDIPPSRVYIEFINIPGKFWGWNGGTF